MLQIIRDKMTGWFAYVLLGALAFFFIFWGVEMRSASGSNYAAKVNGDRISLETVNRAWQERQQSLLQSFRGEIPEPFKKSAQQDILEEKIQSLLLNQQVNLRGYRVGDTELRKAVQAAPNWQVDGKFSVDQYNLAARQKGMSPAQFAEDLRVTLLQRQLIGGIYNSSFVTPAELQRRHALEAEQRELDYALIPMAGFMATANVSDAEIQAYYDANKADFMTTETIDLEYVELRLADVENDVVVSDEALREYYEQIKGRLITPERRSARHILISVGDAAEDAAAKTKADEILAKLKAGGDFAALAKQFSQDTVSAAKGGDLGWAPRETYVPPFDEALFSMAPGELRGPVKTQFGYHIIKLDGVEGGETKSFESVRAEITRDFKTEKAQEKFYDRSQKLGDETFNALNELETAAKSLGLKVQTVIGLSRRGGEAGTLAADPRIVEAAFAPDAIEKRQNSALISVADDRAVVIRVAQHHAPEQEPLAVVRLQIETRLKQQAARNAAAKRGTELVARLAGGADWAKTLAETKLTPVGKKSIARSDNSIPAPLREDLFAIPRSEIAADKVVYRGVPVDSGDFALARVSAITPGKLEIGTPEATSKRQEAAQTVGGEEFSAYLADVEGRAKIERNPKTFE
jgi:peptidyl-prolyl cis-trans isomerase D